MSYLISKLEENLIEIKKQKIAISIIEDNFQKNLIDKKEQQKWKNEINLKKFKQIYFKSELVSLLEKEKNRYEALREVSNGLKDFLIESIRDRLLISETEHSFFYDFKKNTKTKNEEFNTEEYKINSKYTDELAIDIENFFKEEYPEAQAETFEPISIENILENISNIRETFDNNQENKNTFKNN